MKKLYNSLLFSLDGIRFALSDTSFRIELILGLFFVPASFYLANTFIEWALLFGSYIFLLIVELFNTAIETLTDWISPGHHELAKKIKDLSSAAVFFALLLLFTLWGFFILGRTLL